MNIGDRYGNLTIIGPAQRRGDDKKHSYSLARCDCGKEWLARRDSIKTGQIISCGCAGRELRRKLNTKHGLRPRGICSAEYSSWSSMIQRCTNPKNQAYKHYGARGITVCDRWLESFVDFLNDMGSRPDNAMSIERVDNNKNYEPGNCIWATHAEQMKNTRNVKKVLVGGRELTVTDAAKAIGISKNKIYYFVFEHGVSHQEAFDHYANNEPKVAYRHHMTTRRTKRLREKAEA